MANKFELRLIVPAKLVGTIIELLNDEGILISLNPAPAEHKPHHSRHGSTPKHYGRPAPEIVHEELLKALPKALHINQLAKTLGMPIGTISSSMTALRVNNRVEKMPEGGYWKAKR